MGRESRNWQVGFIFEVMYGNERSAGIVVLAIGMELERRRFGGLGKRERI